MSIDWIDKLRVCLQTTAFCLAIAAIQFAFRPEIEYRFSLVYSLSIGLITWALIDFGRHLFKSSADTGWPKGPPMVIFIFACIVAGYVLGTLLADSLLGFSSWSTQNARYSILVTLLASVVITFYFYSKGKGSYLEAKMAEAKAHASESRLKLLQTQIEPHMLFNTLANLRALIGTDPAAAVQMLDRMNDYLRATLNASRATTHPLQTEFDRLRDYLALMAVRMGPRLSFNLLLPQALASHAVPTLLLQPLVGNSIKHGLEPCLQGGSITVRASLAAGFLTLEVSDTGAGVTTSAAAETNSGETDDGFGMAQVRERLASAYEDRASLTITPNIPTGTCVTITLPFQPMPE